MSGLERGDGFPITGYAVGNALGASSREVAKALALGRSGLRPCPFELPFETYCGQFPDVLAPVPPSLAAWDSRLARIALVVLEGVAGAVERACRRWGAERVAVVLGTSTGGILETERAFEAYAACGEVPAAFDLDRQHAFDALFEVVRRRTGAGGPGYVVSSACSSSGKALGAARRLLLAGLADAVLTGGADTLCQTTLRGFGSLEAISRRACRPFCAERDGTSLGEGAAFLLLERDGDGPARLLGVGESSDAHHMSHPHPQGVGARLAMKEALAQAGLGPEAVDHVNAHGTGTTANDAIEAGAIVALFGRSVPVVSTKGYTGHLLGAAAATEAALALLSIECGFVPASLGAEPLDPSVSLYLCLARREGRYRRVLSNSFAFGGSNVSVLLGEAS